jgi:hypothetical protein
MILNKPQKYYCQDTGREVPVLTLPENIRRMLNPIQENQKKRTTKHEYQPDRKQVKHEQQKSNNITI